VLGDIRDPASNSLCGAYGASRKGRVAPGKASF
jgi:hypothetical protein